MTMVSVIIPVYNRQDTVIRALKSVVSQTFRDFELIVVDDGSTDNTVKIIQASGIELNLIVHADNYGVSAARNTGILKANSNLIAFLDSDDYWLPHKLQEQVNFFKENIHAVACQTKEKWIRNDKQVNPGLRHIKSGGNIFLKSLDLCYISPSAIMIRRSVFDRIGLFDESLNVCEDYDLWLRLTSGHEVYLLDTDGLVRIGSRTDQLSSKYSGMDSFRIFAASKLYRNLEENFIYKDSVLKTIGKKGQIYSSGCLKRSRVAESGFYSKLVSILSQ